ncbi:hypothetical protein B0H12DRAFT_150545 [Mycena haematopus]|nr:hypothetical protein B0H12DRAFT_150545 [Mycena haematopus]
MLNLIIEDPAEARRQSDANTVRGARMRGFSSGQARGQGAVQHIVLAGLQTGDEQPRPSAPTPPNGPSSSDYGHAAA